MRRPALALLARTLSGLGASGRAAAASPALSVLALRPFPPAATSTALYHPARTFAALPADGRSGGGGSEGASTLTAASTPRQPSSASSSVSGHDREVTAREIGVPAAVQTARDVLHHAALVHFRETLEHESETRLSMPYQEALALAKACGVATSDSEAAEALSAAHSAGLVLRFQGTVFLRPSEVADLVLRALPDTDLEVRARLATLEAQLAPLEAQKKAIDAAARTRSRRVLWAGLAAFSGQLGLYAYLTWGHPHWGWDATEPWTYMSTQVLIIFSYAFYMYSRRPLDPREVEAHFAASAVKAGVAAQGFDAAAHARLASDVARYRRYLDRQQSHGK